MFRLFTALVVVLFGAPSFAFDRADIERCKRILADGPRLACFDAVTAGVVVLKPDDGKTEPAPASPDGTGQWQVMVEVDPITDQKVVTAFLPSEGRSSSVRRPALVIRCKSRSAEVFINWNDYLSDETSVTIRVDENAPRTERWSPSTDQTATFSPQPDALLKQARKANRVSARITPYRSGPVTVTFPVSGLDAILSEHEEVCGTAKR